jgi:hypothetical protein
MTNVTPDRYLAPRCPGPAATVREGSPGTETGGRFTEFPNRPLSMRRTEKGADSDGEKGEGKEGEGDEGDEGEMRVRS